MTTRLIWLAVFLGVFLGGFAISGCGDDDDSGADGDSDSDADSDADSDTDTDTDEECAPIEWGTGLNVGQTVANWEMEGYADSDGDGVISSAEEVVTQFTLEDLRCLGKQSLVWLVGDIYCSACPTWFGDVQSTLTPVLESENVLVLTSVSQVIGHPGNSDPTIEQAFDYATQYFDGHYVVNDHPLNIMSYPFGAVIDLETMKPLAKGNTDLTAQQILTLVQDANAD